MGDLSSLRAALFELSPDALVGMGEDGRITDWNPQAERLFGWTRKEALGRSLAETLVPARFRDAHESGLKDFLRTGLGPILQRRLRFAALRRDGEEIPVELMINVVESGGRRVFYGTLRDLSAEEAARLESQRTVAGWIHRFETLLNASGLVFYDWNYGTGEVTFAGDLARFLGVSPPEMPATAQGWLDRVHPEDLPAFRRAAERLATTGEPYRLTYRVRRADGTYRHIEDTGWRQKAAPATGLSIAGFLLDVTERVEAEQSLREAQSQLLQVQRLDSVGQLAGGIAHDFNNLLAAILGFGTVLARDLKGNDKAQTRLKAILQSAARGAELTRQLLGFARKGLYRKEVSSLEPIVAEAKEVLSRSLDKRITIRSGPFGGIWPIEADSTQILQVLINLGLNARDAMPEGGEVGLEARNLTLSPQQAAKLGVKPDRYVCLSVRDTGCGIPPEIQGNIFDPFFTTKEVGKGTGLGLAMVYGIMRSHGGAVTVDSSPGRGAEFRLYFPAAAETDAAAGALSELAASPAYGERLKGKTILVVDDEPLLRNLAHDLLEPLGAKLFFAEDGIRAIEVFRTHEKEIDIVLLDVGMPRLDGIAAYKRLRELSPEVKVVFATGYTESVEIRALLQGENVLFVEKPFTVQALTEKLEG